MAVFIDSDVLILALRGEEAAIQRVGKAIRENPPLVIPSLVYFEVACGPLREVQKLAEFSGKVVIAPFRKESAVIAASLFKAMRSKGAEVPAVDIAIAATALADSDSSQAKLLTNNKKHFGKIPGLILL